MKLDYIFKKYQDHHWVEEDGDMSMHAMDYWRACYLNWISYFNNTKLYSFCIFLVENNHLYEWTSFEESEKVLNWLVKKYKKDKKYWQKKDKEYKEVNKNIDDIFYFFRDNNCHNLTNKQLKNYLEYLMNLGNIQFGYNLIAEAMDIVDEDYYKKLLPDVPSKKLLDIVNLFSKPDNLGFLEKEHLAILKISRKYFKNSQLKNFLLKGSFANLKKFPDFYSDIKLHQKDYFWIQNNYQQAKSVKIDYFLGAINDIFTKMSLAQINKQIDYLNSKQKYLLAERLDIYKQYKISQEAKDFFALLRLLAAWQDRRKENIQKILSAVDKIFDETSQRSGVTKLILREYFISELGDLLLKGKKVPTRSLTKRKIVMFYSYLGKNNCIKKEVFYGRDILRAKKYFQRYNNKIIGDGLKGFVASSGKNQSSVVGKVRIVLSANKAKFNSGEILVTGMTRPEFVPLMKKAKAIITNEGGITTHAAIISRELKIPCIIGTKVATEVLKTGDKIKMDLKQGIIKKI